MNSINQSNEITSFTIQITSITNSYYCILCCDGMTKFTMRNMHFSLQSNTNFTNIETCIIKSSSEISSILIMFIFNYIFTTFGLVASSITLSNITSICAFLTFSALPVLNSFAIILGNTLNITFPTS